MSQSNPQYNVFILIENNVSIGHFSKSGSREIQALCLFSTVPPGCNALNNSIL